LNAALHAVEENLNRCRIASKVTSRDNHRCIFWPLLLQPYVENAIVHGIRNKEQGQGRLVIDITLKNNQVIVVIADNGIGRKRSRRLHEENKTIHQSIGMNVTEKRIQLLGLLERNNITLTITDLTEDEDTGTRVEIILPYSVHL